MFDYTHDLALERINKDEQQKKFRQSRALKGKTAAVLVGKTSLLDGTLIVEKNDQESEICTLDILYDLKQKNKIAELNSFTEAFVCKTQSDGLTSLFITTTVKSEYNIVKADIEDAEICLAKSEKQYELHDKFFTDFLNARLFKNPKTTKDGFDWYYIPVELRPFLKSSELTSFKSWSEHLYNIHQHTALFIPDDKKAVKEILRLLEQKKQLNDIGRLDIRIDPKYKPMLEKDFALTPVGKRVKGKQYYRFNRNQSDIDAKDSGSFIVVSFFDKNEAMQKQVVGYVLKYVLKNVNAHVSETPFEEKLDDFAYRSKAIFSKLGRRPFSYSKKYTFKLTDFRKLAAKAVKYDPRFKRLAYWTEMQDKGLLNVRTIKNSDGKVIRLELWLTQYFANTGVSFLISDWDADQYEIVKTYSVIIGLKLHKLQQEAA
jgi:hypothetical protein